MKIKAGAKRSANRSEVILCPECGQVPASVPVMISGAPAEVICSTCGCLLIPFKKLINRLDPRRSDPVRSRGRPL